MWNPTASSDNKQNIREQADDDCKCISSGGIEQLNQHKQQQTSKSYSGTNESNDIGQKFLDQSEETIDSGFISGPQTTSEANLETYMGTETVAGGGDSGDIKKLNTSESTTLEQEYNQSYYDSGVVEEEFAEGLEKQDFSSTEESSKMILPKSVESGISEWFCNLNLNNNSNTANNNALSLGVNAPISNTRTVTGLNNLDAPKNEQLTASAAVEASQQQQHKSSKLSNAQETDTTIPQQITPANAWEKYYQQDDEGDTPLHMACISGHVDVVAALIRMAPHPCLFNIKNDEAQTPLHLATLTAQPKIIRMLLIAGAEPTIRDRYGNTALHLACISGEEQCVRALTIPISASEVHEAHRQYGHRANDKSYLKCAQLPADLEIRNYDGEACVHLAAQAGFINILRILVLYGADINAREGKAGRTPLHLAVECCNAELANYLLEDCQKLNLEAVTYAGHTAYQVACILNKSKMQCMLEQRGAELLTPPDSDYDSSDNETDYNDAKFHNCFGDPGYFAGFKGGNAMTVA